MRRRCHFLAVTAFLGCAGCANPGQPRPPSLRLPQKAQKPAAERVGGQVMVTWTTPDKTTDKEAIRGAVTAVLCREASPSKAVPNPPCTPVAREIVTPGPSRVAEVLPANLAAGAPRLLTYRVELENYNGRAAGPSQPVFAAAGAAPPTVGPLAISGRREGALIAWTKAADAAPVLLTRTQLAPAPQPKQPGSSKAAKPLTFAGSSSPEASQPAIVELKTPPGLNADPGGVIDHTARNGYTYSYVAERVATVNLGGHALTLRSLTSPAATFTYRNVFPPKAPTGLVSVPGGGFGEPQSIDLSWDANLESDVLGYNVYRKDVTPGSAGDFVRLNPQPLPDSAFRDLTAEPGHTYIYRVTAVDQQHNESAPGDEIHETLRK